MELHDLQGQIFKVTSNPTIPEFLEGENTPHPLGSGSCLERGFILIYFPFHLHYAGNPSLVAAPQTARASYPFVVDEVLRVLLSISTALRRFRILLPQKLRKGTKVLVLFLDRILG